MEKEIPGVNCKPSIKEPSGSNAEAASSLSQTSTLTQDAGSGLSSLAANANLHQLFDAFPMGVNLADARMPGLPLIFVNPAFLALTGYTYDDVIGRNSRFLQGPETSRAAVTELGKAIRAGRQHSTVLRNHRRDGTIFWNELMVAPMYDAEGKISFFLGVQNDVTARVEAEQGRAALLKHTEEMRLRAERDVRARNGFLSATTHDLRTPITTLRGRAQLVQRRLKRGQTVDTSWLGEQMDAIAVATSLMLNTINELGDVARLQSGRTLELQIGPVDLGLLAKAVAENLAARHNIGTIHIATPGEVVAVQADRARIERVLQNVVFNAVKYSRDVASIDITVKTIGAMVLTTVRDKGVGIPPDELSHIFEYFDRASTARDITGSGLGLVGAQAVVSQHGGVLTIESRVGVGTTVSIALPVTGPAAPAE